MSFPLLFSCPLGAEASAAGRSRADAAESPTGTNASGANVHPCADMDVDADNARQAWKQTEPWRQSLELTHWLRRNPPLNAPWPSAVNAAQVMEALKSPEGEAICCGQPAVARQLIDWVDGGCPPRPAGAKDCFKNLIRLVSFVHGGSPSHRTPPEDRRIASGLLEIWRRSMQEAPAARGLAWALIKRRRLAKRYAISVPLGAIEPRRVLQGPSLSARRPDARFVLPLLTSALSKPLAAFARECRDVVATSARLAWMVEEAERLGVLGTGSFLVLDAASKHAGMALMPWIGLAPLVRKVVLRELADVRNIPAELAPWIRTIEVRTELPACEARTLRQSRDLFPNLRKIILSGNADVFVHDAPDGLRDFDEFRSVYPGSCGAFHRHVAGFSMHGRDLFFGMAAVLLDVEEDPRRLRQVLLAVLQDDDLSACCRLAVRQGDALEPPEMLECLELLIQDRQRASGTVGAVPAIEPSAQDQSMGSTS